AGWLDDELCTWSPSSTSNVERSCVLLLMRNLSINLSSSDFEDHRRLLSSYKIESDSTCSGGAAVTCDG
ncbi:REVEILLE 6-like protein, partial [Drosera capensis]